MGRTDAARREEIGVTPPHGIDRRDDLRLDIGDDAHFPQVDAYRRQVVGK